MKKRQLIIKFFILPVIFLFSSVPVFGAKLYLDSDKDEYGFGDTASFVLRLDTEGECINAVSAEFDFPNNLLISGKFYYGDSLFPLWIKPPKIDQAKGKITFVGGIPGGYCGRISGDPGTEGIVGEIVFKMLGMSVGGASDLTAEVAPLPFSQILLNDGAGTSAKLTLQGKAIKILSKKSLASKTPEDSQIQELLPTLEEFKNDKLPPEPFTVELRQDPRVFHGRYFVVFQTIDKQTGVDYYEAKEGDRDWVKARSPYLLLDQGLSAAVDVRAWDNSGNFTLSEYVPKGFSESPSKLLGDLFGKVPVESLIFPGFIVAVCSFLFFVAWIAYRVARKRKKSRR